MLHLEGAHGYCETWDWPLHPPDDDDMYAYGMTVSLTEMYYSSEPFGDSPLVDLERQRHEHGSSRPLDPVARDLLEGYLAEEPMSGIDRETVTDVASIAHAAMARWEHLASALDHLDVDRRSIVERLAAAEDHIVRMSQYRRTRKDLRTTLYAGSTLRDLRAGRSILESWVAP